jgi:hypothetical protein
VNLENNLSLSGRGGRFVDDETAAERELVEAEEHMLRALAIVKALSPWQDTVVAGVSGAKGTYAFRPAWEAALARAAQAATVYASKIERLRLLPAEVPTSPQSPKAKAIASKRDPFGSLVGAPSSRG